MSTPSLPHLRAELAELDAEASTAEKALKSRLLVLRNGADVDTVASIDRGYAGLQEVEANRAALSSALNELLRRGSPSVASEAAVLQQQIADLRAWTATLSEMRANMSGFSAGAQSAHMVAGEAAARRPEWLPGTDVDAIFEPLEAKRARFADNLDIARGLVDSTHIYGQEALEIYLITADYVPPTEQTLSEWPRDWPTYLIGSIGDATPMRLGNSENPGPRSGSLLRR